MMRRILGLGLALALLLSIAPHTASAQTGGRVHVVQSGESLYRIALKYNVSATALAMINGISNPNRIHSGQRLVIPAAGAGSASPPPAPPPLQPAATHRIVAGETLSDIAYRYGVTVRELAAANAIVNTSKIYVGQVLRIPGTGASRGAPPASANPGGKRILVSISRQHLWAYEGDRTVYSFVASTGMARSPTAPGRYRVLDKIPNAYASTWNLQMPHWLGIYYVGRIENGIHALPILPNGQKLWEGLLGRPASFGCVILSTRDAETLYNWATVGAPVIIEP